MKKILDKTPFVYYNSIEGRATVYDNIYTEPELWRIKVDKLKKKTVEVPVKVVMESTASLDKEVEDELDIPDPPMRAAAEALINAIEPTAQDFRWFTSLNKTP